MVRKLLTWVLVLCLEHSILIISHRLRFARTRWDNFDSYTWTLDLDFFHIPSFPSSDPAPLPYFPLKFAVIKPTLKPQTWHMVDMVNYNSASIGSDGHVVDSDHISSKWKIRPWWYIWIWSLIINCDCPIGLKLHVRGKG